MEIKFKKDTIFDGKYYFAGDVLTEIKNKNDIWKLNEKGFIEPISYKEFIELEEGK